MFLNALQCGDFWKRLFIVFVWTDENGGFRIRWCHTLNSACPVRHAIIFPFVWTGGNNSNSPLWGCAGERVEMVVKCVVGPFWWINLPHVENASPKTVPRCTLPTNSTRSPAQPCRTRPSKGDSWSIKIQANLPWLTFLQFTESFSKMRQKLMNVCVVGNWVFFHHLGKANKQRTSLSLFLEHVSCANNHVTKLSIQSRYGVGWGGGGVIAEIMDWNHVPTRIFFTLSFQSCVSCVHNWDDHSSV